MHPVEVIRWVLGHPGADPAEVASEVAMALAAMSPSDRTLSARRVVERRPTDAVLRWACARVLCSLDPVGEARAVVSLLWSDETVEEAASVPLAGARLHVVPHRVDDGGIDRLTEALVTPRSPVVRLPSLVGPAMFDLRPDLEWVGAADEAEVVLIEPVAAGAAGVVVGTGQADAVGGAGERLVVAVSRGRALPDPHLRALEAQHDLALVEIDRRATIVGPAGPVEDGMAGLASLVDCPVAPELISR